MPCAGYDRQCPGKFIPAHQFTANREIKLPESIMVQTVTGEYTDDHWDFVEPTDTDMLLRPDASTLRMVPWAREPTGQVIADCYKALTESPIRCRRAMCCDMSWVFMRKLASSPL
ncbi:MAG: hypothetical protein CM15mP74_16040 [Halieaceae bacterium]|nr:MAG: hypothetical protein CM15mP74_16040 [Halieaceae bacterium]